uniref:PLA2c domain-containing protein n=1 Tax=Scleropages formosus TaxID=113540 RepID=A0A8C9TWN4_SCLFO
MRKSVVCYFSFPFRRYVRVPKSLNLKEEEYVTGRQAVVEKCLKDNGIKYRQEHVPVIAVLGSGGGERAMVGLLGVLAQMGEDKLLDSITYLCGVSGCTWCMASLYEDPKWSVNVANYSLTDFWAATVVYYIIKEIDRHHLSEQEARDSTNPYPIYTAIDKGLKQDNQTAPCWFEITPHEAGYSLLGAYVDTSHFGSQFEAGKLKKAIKEEDMLYLQGLCGSAIADGMENITEILQWIWDWIHSNMISFLLAGIFPFLKILQKTIIAAHNWTWGTKFNFLYNITGSALCPEVEHIPAALLSDEKRDLIDAGILLNSPCVALLRPERKVDLILFFDFSRDDPFLTVKKAADYCKEAGIPFPSVVIEPGEEKNPKDFYVFKDETKAPIVIHIPLFNTVNCGEKIEEWRKRYKTFQDPYSKEMIEDLLLVSSRNVKNNKEKILNEIKAACAR